MGFLSIYNQTERIDLGDGYWVEVRKHLSHSAYAIAQRKLISPRMDGMPGTDGSTVRSEIDTAAYQEEIVTQAICDWNLTDENDGPLPLHPIEARRASVGRLPQFVVDRIFQLVSEADGERPADEKVRFPVAGDGGDPVGDGRPAGAAGVLAG